MLCDPENLTIKGTTKQNWFRFMFLGKVTESVIPLEQLTEEHVRRAVKAISGLERNNVKVTRLTILADNVLAGD